MFETFFLGTQKFIFTIGQKLFLDFWLPPLGTWAKNEKKSTLFQIAWNSKKIGRNDFLILDPSRKQN